MIADWLHFMCLDVPKWVWRSHKLSFYFVEVEAMDRIQRNKWQLKRESTLHQHVRLWSLQLETAWLKLDTQLPSRDDACKAWGLWSNSRVHTIRAYNEISRMWLKMVQEKAHRPNWIRHAFWFSRVEWWNIWITPSVLGRETWGESDTNQPCSPLCSAVRCDCGCQLQPPDFKTQPTVFTPHAGWISNSAECWVTANPTLTCLASATHASPLKET